MKIGFDAKRLFHNNTGLGNYSRNLLASFSEFYQENSYLLYNPKPKIIDRFRLSSNTVEVLPTGFWKNFPGIWRQKGILNAVSKHHLDIFHGLSGELPQGIHKFNIKKIVTIHDLIFLRFPKLYNPIDRQIYYSKIKYATQVADIIITVSEQTKSDIISFLKVPESKIKVIYQGCDCSFKKTYTSEEKIATLEKYDIPDSFILNVGTIEARKNLLTLIKAIKEINTQLVVIGKGGSYKKKMLKYITKQHLEDKVLFLEDLSLKEISIVYQQAKIFVFPSIFEGFGIPIIEALYCKTPVITSKGSCFSEVAGPYSLYVDPYDDVAITRHIRALLEDDTKRKKQIDLSYDFVQKFNDVDIAYQYMDVYKSLLKN